VPTTLQTVTFDAYANCAGQQLESTVHFGCTQLKGQLGTSFAASDCYNLSSTAFSLCEVTPSISTTAIATSSDTTTTSPFMVGHRAPHISIHSPNHDDRTLYPKRYFWKYGVTNSSNEASQLLYPTSVDTCNQLNPSFQGLGVPLVYALRGGELRCLVSGDYGCGLAAPP
jgi:hypothetical protein